MMQYDATTPTKNKPKKNKRLSRENKERKTKKKLNYTEPELVSLNPT